VRCICISFFFCVLEKCHIPFLSFLNWLRTRAALLGSSCIPPTCRGPRAVGECPVQRRCVPASLYPSIFGGSMLYFWRRDSADYWSCMRHEMFGDVKGVDCGEVVLPHTELVLFAACCCRRPGEGRSKCLCVFFKCPPPRRRKIFVMSEPPTNIRRRNLWVLDVCREAVVELSAPEVWPS
jgi:hypothetical protein